MRNSLLKTTNQKRKRLIRELVLEENQLDIDDFTTLTPDVQNQMKVSYNKLKYTARSRERSIERGKQQYDFPDESEFETYRQFQEHKHASPKLLRTFSTTNVDETSLLGEVYVKPPKFKKDRKHVNKAKIGVRMHATTRQHLITLLNCEFLKVSSGLESRYNIVSEAGATSPVLYMEHDEWEVFRSRAWRNGKQGDKSVLFDVEMLDSEHLLEVSTHDNETIHSEYLHASSFSDHGDAEMIVNGDHQSTSSRTLAVGTAMDSEQEITSSPSNNLVPDHDRVETSKETDSHIYHGRATVPLTIIDKFFNKVSNFLNF